ncbi:hypothetical protein BOTBODRAFT_44179 [Botryobasidium botryosum FD-172 SS1]|uniref:Uncharacterized protein n=1 Tax=Botryobasidium botryosum (strain FD-172 SS1) TaxID=930990 RepID=A0A067MUF9_BOTB1|nr:hypothetical protein BOTBODRAFT_44179 [Botryobasidium botryosum FD-172 SS1]
MAGEPRDGVDTPLLSFSFESLLPMRAAASRRVCARAGANGPFVICSFREYKKAGSWGDEAPLLPLCAIGSTYLYARPAGGAYFPSSLSSPMCYPEHGHGTGKPPMCANWGNESVWGVGERQREQHCERERERRYKGKRNMYILALPIHGVRPVAAAATLVVARSQSLLAAIHLLSTDTHRFRAVSCIVTFARYVTIDAALAAALLDVIYV